MWAMYKGIAGCCLGMSMVSASVAAADTVSQWPINEAEPWNQLSSPFGSRLEASEDYRYDFHRGIDIPASPGTTIQAITDGTIFRMYSENDPDNPYPGLGNVVIIKHYFNQPCLFHDVTRTYYYSLYGHLSVFAEDLSTDQAVHAGAIIGYAGDSGTASYSHLHFEIRVGTTCSLESSCSKGYDPHVNPLTFLSYPETNSITAQAIIDNDDVVITVAVPRAELDINRFIVQTDQQTKVLDFNTREGLNASSTAALDQASYNGITIVPQVFSDTAVVAQLTITFQHMMSPDITSANVTIDDVHGNQLFFKQLNSSLTSSTTNDNTTTDDTTTTGTNNNSNTQTNTNTNSNTDTVMSDSSNRLVRIDKQGRELHIYFTDNSIQTVVAARNKHFKYVYGSTILATVYTKYRQAYLTTYQLLPDNSFAFVQRKSWYLKQPHEQFQAKPYTLILQPRRRRIITTFGKQEAHKIYSWKLTKAGRMHKIKM